MRRYSDLFSLGSLVGFAVFGEDSFDSAVCNPSGDKSIHFCNESFVAECKCECIGLGGHVLIKNNKLGFVVCVVFLYHSDSGEVVDNPSVYLAVGESHLCIGVAFESRVGIAVFNAVSLCGGTGLAGDLLAVKVCLGSDGAAFKNNDSLSCFIVRNGEEGVLLTCFGNGDAGNANVILACLNAGENRIECHLFDNELLAELFADKVKDVDFDTNNLAAFKVFEGREIGAGSDNELVGSFVVGCAFAVAACYAAKSENKSK